MQWRRRLCSSGGTFREAVAPPVQQRHLMLGWRCINGLGVIQVAELMLNKQKGQHNFKLPSNIVISPWACSQAIQKGKCTLIVIVKQL